MDEATLLDRLTGISADDRGVARALMVLWGPQAPERLVALASPALVRSIAALRTPGAAAAVAAVANAGPPTSYLADHSVSVLVQAGDAELLDVLMLHGVPVRFGPHGVMEAHAAGRLDSPDPALRLAAIATLRDRTHRERRAEALAPLLHDADAEVAAAAARALGVPTAPDPGQRADLLIPLLAHPDERVAAAAAGSLDARAAAAVDALRRAADDPRPAVVAAALAGLETAPAGRRLLAQLRGAAPTEPVSLRCGVCGVEAARYAVYPPWAERPMGGRAPVGVWAWGPEEDRPAATGAATEDVRQARPARAIAAAERDGWTIGALRGPWHRLREAVCPSCDRSWCAAHRESSVDDPNVGLPRWTIEREGRWPVTETITYPCGHQRSHQLSERPPLETGRAGQR